MKSKLRMRNKFFSVGMILFLMLFVIACGGGGGDGGGDSAPPTYNISGAVSGATLTGVTINLTGAATTSTTTDAGGNFSITGLYNGAYTVTPVNTGFTFAPSSSAVTVSGANVTVPNFVAATSGSQWSTQTIDQVNAANNDISAAIDANNAIHVCYSNFNLGLKYATNKTGTWVSTYIHQEDINTTVSSGDIAVDGNNNVHIVYNTGLISSPYTAALYYATNSSGSWIKTKLVETVDPWTGSFSGSGIIATSNGKVHIAFGNSDMQLRYLNNISGSWSAPILIGSYWTSVRPHLALDSNNNVYIAYEHGGEGSLRLQVVNSSGSLVSNTVLDGPGVSGTGISTGWSPNIAINKASNLMYVSYWDENNNLLKLYSAGGITTIDSCDWNFSGIAVDQNGKVYISYVDNSFNLRYATNKSGSWVVENLSIPAGGSSSNSDIVIESTGKIDLIYASRPGGNLRVTSK